MRVAKSIVPALVLALGTFPAFGLGPFWQKHAPPPRTAPPPANSSSFAGNPANSQSGGSAGQFHLNGPGPHKGDWLRKYYNLPAPQQEQKLKQDPAFRNLPADRQEHLLDRLRKFNSEPPEKKQQILNRMETFEHLSPEQQQATRSLFQRYQSLPEDRRTRVLQEYRVLRGMPPEQRVQTMNSDAFRNNFNDEERDLLRGMSTLNSPVAHPE